jgi:hypothetical protein
LEKQLITTRLVHDLAVSTDRSLPDTFYEDRDDVYVLDMSRRLEGLAPPRFHAFYHAIQAVVALALATLAGMVTAVLMHGRQPPPKTQQSGAS